jgi:hypothetical protein
MQIPSRMISQMCSTASSLCGKATGWCLLWILSMEKHYNTSFASFWPILLYNRKQFWKTEWWLKIIMSGSSVCYKSRCYKVEKSELLLADMIWSYCETVYIVQFIAMVLHNTVQDCHIAISVSESHQTKAQVQ